MLSRIVSGVSRQVVARASSTISIPVKTNDWFLFPRETEGNNYSVNWSLAEDGVTNSQDAYRNARLPILTNRLSSKVENGVVSLKKPVYTGKSQVQEAGDGISHSDFQNKFSSMQQYLSSGVTLFIEDASLGAYNKSRVGVRVISDDAGVALACRSLLMPTPPRAVNHKARFRGWNMDPRWVEPEVTWNGSSYDISETPTFEAQGQRPVVVHMGGAGSEVGLQFVENSSSEIVGANIIAGGDSSVRAVIDAVGTACCAVINAQNASDVALPSLSVLKSGGSKTALVLGADDDLCQMACSKNVVHGAYHNVLTPAGVSAMWNGAITTAGKASGNVPSVVVDGKCATPINPNNLAFPADHIMFYKKGSKRSSVSEADAIKMLVDLSDESKEEAIRALVKSAKFEIVGDVDAVFA